MHKYKSLTKIDVDQSNSSKFNTNKNYTNSYVVIKLISSHILLMKIKQFSVRF